MLENSERKCAAPSVVASTKSGGRIVGDAPEISSAGKEKLDAAPNHVKEALKGTDVAAIKTAGENLKETWQAVPRELCISAETPRTGRVPESAQPRYQIGEDNNTAHCKKDGEPVIDAEVVEERQPRYGTHRVSDNQRALVRSAFRFLWTHNA